MKPTETVEKISLPDDETISSERQHQDLLSGLQAGVELRRADTREPINPLELAKLETSKDQVADQIQAFDRYNLARNDDHNYFASCRSVLTPVVTEEKHFMPTLEELKHETLHSELDTLDKETHAGAAGLQEFLTKEAAEEQSSSSPEELVPEVAEVAGAAGVRNLLERDSRERSSSGEEWEKVSDPNLYYTVQRP